MNTSTRERRDWTFLIFLIPIGIILMLIAGQCAVRLVPVWRVNAGMQSKLDPNNLSIQQNAPVQPISPAILTPLGWLDTFLTPGNGGSGNQNIVFPPFVVFEPTATPVVTASPPPPTVATTQPPATIPVTQTPTVVVTPSATPTKKPTDPPTSTPPPTSTTPPPTSTTPPPTSTPPPVTSTLVAQTQVPSSPLPVTLNIGPPSGNPTYNLHDNNYIVIDLGPIQANQLRVNGPSPTTIYPDMVYYESFNCTGICMDQVIIGISQFSNGSVYYTVFNWGDNVPDTNSNVSDVDGVPFTENEADNQPIATSYLYGTPPYQTGITIDVDHAPSAPPVGLYQYIVIQAPVTVDNDGADIDAIEIIPDPPMGNMPSPLADASPPSADAAPPQVDAAPPPADTAPPQVDAVPPPADAVPPPVDAAPQV